MLFAILSIKKLFSIVILLHFSIYKAPSPFLDEFSRNLVLFIIIIFEFSILAAAVFRLSLFFIIFTLFIKILVDFKM